MEQIGDLELQIKGTKKTLKFQEKEIHNLNNKFTNSQDSKLAFKAELSQAKAE